jgi:hypothetical protein
MAVFPLAAETRMGPLPGIAVRDTLTSTSMNNNVDFFICFEKIMLFNAGGIPLEIV